MGLEAMSPDKILGKTRNETERTRSIQNMASKPDMPDLEVKHLGQPLEVGLSNSPTHRLF